MDAHEYICFSLNLNVLCIFRLTSFLVWFFFISDWLLVQGLTSSMTDSLLTTLLGVCSTNFVEKFYLNIVSSCQNLTLFCHLEPPSIIGSPLIAIFWVMPSSFAKISMWHVIYILFWAIWDQVDFFTSGTKCIGKHDLLRIVRFPCWEMSGKYCNKAKDACWLYDTWPCGKRYVRTTWVGLAPTIAITPT